MVVVQASKLHLPSPSISSLLFEPNSLSLALTHSDSSISLYPSLSLPPTSLPARQTLIPSPSSSSAFLLLQSQNPSPNSDSDNGPSPRVIFVVAGPHGGGSRVLLRFYALRSDNNDFARAQVICGQKGIDVDRKFGVLLNVAHGVSVKISASINYLALHSVSSSKILVFGVKLMDAGGDDDAAVVVKLMRCAVVECSRPVWSMSISFGFLILGEENGVRVLNLRELVKGKKVRKVRSSSKVGVIVKPDVKRSRLPNGVIRNDDASDLRLGSETASSGCLDCKKDNRAMSVKQSVSKCRQESVEGGACFVPLKKRATNDLNSKARSFTSIKATSIQALSPRRFLILDSAGDLHVLLVSGPIVESNITCHVKLLPEFLDVQRVLVLPVISPRSQTFWVSVGDYTVHMMTFFDEDDASNEKNKNESGEKHIPITVNQTIFVAEKVQDAVPFPDSGIMVLGQGSPFLLGFGWHVFE